MVPGNIKVVVRVRPFNGRELDRKAKCVVQMRDEQTVLVPPPDAEERLRGSKGGRADGQKVFAFDKSYWSFNKADSNFAGQDNLFNDLGSPLLDNAFQGYNNCIFAYGQTGSGKSYSMMGYGEEAGVIPRICRDMFERITDIQKDKNLTCTVEVSYLEIYNERVRDLLNPTTKGNLKVREHPATGPYVEDLAKLVVRSFQEIANLMDEGNKARTVAATNMNETSSRSHAVFTLTLTQKRHDVETSMDTEKVAKISLVDLAGSERATSTGATGARLKEGAEINRSLSTLGRVIAALADLSAGKKKNMSMVPYRDSVLTWLLKDSLGGNSLTAMIAAISPADINFEETLSTLRYADSAKRIKNHAVINEDPNARMIRELKEELAQLRSKLSSGATSGGIAEEQYAPDTPLDKQIVSITQADGTIKKVSKADIAEQLNQSEKLYEDLNQTWEEKLQKTETIHKEREAALEELGISIEKGFVGLSTPKKMPHLVNLSDDPLLAECLVYNIKPGITTVGNVDDPVTTAEIRLNGTKILHDHCTFENVDNVVTVTPREDAALMVNGQRVDKPKRLRSGNRIILGDFHIFRFQHPQEARQERAEQSLLRHSVTTSQLGSPAPRPAGHERNLSKAGSDVDGESSRAESPLPVRSGRDSDWSMARREAATAILGTDQKINQLNDDELDTLFDDVQRARAVRRGRPESRMFGPDDEDMESVSSYPVRDKYLSNGTIDNFSTDTVLTLPGTPEKDGHEAYNDGDDRLQHVRDDMQAQLEKQKEDYQEKLRVVEASSQDIEELRLEREKMEETLQAAKADFQQQLDSQKQGFEAKLHKMLKSSEPRITKDGFTDVLDEEKPLIRKVIRRWKRLRYPRLAAAILENVALLKEAQVMSQAMERNVTFQFTIVDVGSEMCSSYDLVLSGISGEDEVLEDASKPCIAIRVVDSQRSVIHLWSIAKLESRVQAMRQVHQYIDRPDYMRHFNPENPFGETFQPQFSLIGVAHIALTAVFEARVQDCSVQVVSPYTREVIGTVKLSLEPSSAEAPSSMLKFNVVMREMIGFAEREGTDVHAQMFVPGFCEDGGATTTQMIRDFDESPIRFESIHGMSLPQCSSHDATLQVSIFARVTPLHLDRLSSWDEMRESTAKLSKVHHSPQKHRVRESEYLIKEQHDVFAKLQVLEMTELGEYHPVEVEQHSNLDPGTYQLHQGLQRRIALHLNHSSSDQMHWMDVTSLRIGHIQLIDPHGKVADHSATPDISLKLVQEPSVARDASGTTAINVIGQWDSSLHNSTLLDRPTAEKYTVRLTIYCDVRSSRVNAPLTFALDQNIQIRPRSWFRPQSMFKQLWKTSRIVHSTVGIFSVILKPSPSKRPSELWRLDSHVQYVKGEEDLLDWSPRGISLIEDFVASKQKMQLRMDVEAAKAITRGVLPSRKPNGVSESESSISPQQKGLINHCLSTWQKPPKPLFPTTLSTALPNPPLPSSPSPTSTTKLTASITPQSKNPTILKQSHLLMPSPTPNPTHWLLRFAELRSPYLHIHSVPDGDEIQIINLRNARIDAEPEVRKLLQRRSTRRDESELGNSGGGGGGNVFAVYGTGGSWLFRARSEAQKMEWILAVDRAFVGGGDDGLGSGSGSNGRA